MTSGRLRLHAPAGGQPSVARWRCCSLAPLLRGEGRGLSTRGVIPGRACANPESITPMLSVPFPPVVMDSGLAGQSPRPGMTDLGLWTALRSAYAVAAKYFG